MNYDFAVRVALLISLISLVCGTKPESSKSSSSGGSSSSSSHHKHRPKRYDEDGPSEQVYYVDQIASDSEISPWTSNRIIAKTTDEVIIHDGGASDRTSDQEPDQDQSPQDFVQQALRLREHYMKGSGAKASTPVPASSFVEYTTTKYDHFGPSKSPPSAAPAHHSKPVPSKTHHPAPAQVAAISGHQSQPVNYRPKHIKPKPTKIPVNTVTPFSDIELPEAETTSPLRKEKPKDQPKSPKHNPIKQQDTQASTLYIQKVKPMDAVYSSYNTHHETGSSFKEFQHLPLTDSYGSSSILNVQKVKPPTNQRPIFHHEENKGYHEKKHKHKHISSEEIRYKPKHKTHNHHHQIEQAAEFYPEKIRHTVERQPAKIIEESSADPFEKYYLPKATVKEVKLEPEAVPSVESYRYQPPKSYPPEEASKFKFTKEIPSTAEPYKPYHHVRTYTEDKHVIKEESVRHQPSPRPHHYEFSNPSPKPHHVERPSSKPKYNDYVSKDDNYPQSFLKAHHMEITKHEPYKPSWPKVEEFANKHPEVVKIGPTLPPKYYEEPSPAPSYAKVTTYPTKSASNSQQVYHRVKSQQPGDPYKLKPSPTPEITIASHGFQKPTAPNFPKYIPTKMPELEDPKASFSHSYPSAESLSNFIPSSTQESYSASPEYPKVFSLAPTTYTPKYSISPTPDTFDFPHMSEAPKSFSKYSEPTPSTKVYGTIVPSEQPFKTLSTKIYMKPSPTELSFPELKETSMKSLQNRTTSVEFSPSPTEDPQTEYYTNPEHTTYYVFANGTEIKLGNDPSKIPPEFRVTPGDASFFSSNYSTKLAEDFAMKFNWDSIPSSTRDSDFFLSPESAVKEGRIKLQKSKPPLKFSKSLKPIKTVTIYRNTHRSADDTEMEGGFEPSDHYFKQGADVPQISDKRGEVTDDDEDFFFANGEVILQDDPNKATKKNAIFLPQGLNNPQVMLKLAQQQQQLQQQQLQQQQLHQQQLQHQQLQQQQLHHQKQPQQLPLQQQQVPIPDQQVPDMDMSAEPSKKHQYFVLYHIEDNKKKPRPTPPTTTLAPTPPPVKQEIHYHYSEKENEDPEVTHEHYNYHHEETIEDLDDDVQHHYINPNAGKLNFRPNIAHPSFKYKDNALAGSETSVRVVDPDFKQVRPMEITKQEYMRHVQNTVLKYMKQLQDEGRLPVVSPDTDETQKTFEELDIEALLNGNNPKHKFQLNPSVKPANLPMNPSQYKPMKTVPSSSSYKSVANMKIPKNTYPAGKPLKSAIETLQEQLGNSVDLTIKGTKAPFKPDLSAIDVGQSYLHGPTYDPPSPIKSLTASFDGPPVVKIPAQKNKLHFNQQTYHDINSLTNLKDSHSLKSSSPYSSIKGGSANVGASISFGGTNKVATSHPDDIKLGPEALDAPIQIINGIPVTNPYNIDMNTLRYMLGGLAQAQAEQNQAPIKQQEPTLKLKGSNWMSLPTMASPSQIFNSNMQTFHHGPSEANNYKYNANFDSSNFKIKMPQKMKDFSKAKPVGIDSIGSTSMNYASWGEPPRQNRQLGHFQQQQQQQHQHHHYHPQLQQQQQLGRPNREFNPEVFLNPQGQYMGPVMKKKNGPVDRNSAPSKPPVPATKPKTSLDTNLRPPPPA
ncbi:uncharacterized protein LOC134220540 isoform X2 [Armigeres subalbatus]|uniref:uncharacterized protein LOC134220540 isoform X2 n=1 Tax=Armigeres subalbatus TaxID=124917 RepID=UPI002ED43A74